MKHLYPMHGFKSCPFVNTMQQCCQNSRFLDSDQDFTTEPDTRQRVEGTRCLANPTVQIFIKGSISRYDSSKVRKIADLFYSDINDLDNDNVHAYVFKTLELHPLNLQWFCLAAINF